MRKITALNFLFPPVTINPAQKPDFYRVFIFSYFFHINDSFLCLEGWSVLNTEPSSHYLGGNTMNDFWDDDCATRKKSAKKNKLSEKEIREARESLKKKIRVLRNFLFCALGAVCATVMICFLYGFMSVFM